MSELEFHEAANIFPLNEAFIASLADDIRERGQKVPIETCGGKILDGRHRYHACRKAGVEPQFVEVAGDDPVGHVVTRNLMRYHEDESVRAMAAAQAGALRARYSREAEERKAQAGNTVGRGRPKQLGARGPQANGEAGKTTDRLGAAFNVSGTSVKRAVRVLKGTPELVEAVKQGRMSVRKAADLADQPEEVQRMEVSKPRTKRSSEANGATPALADVTQPVPDADPKAIKARGRVFDLVAEAINILSRIPKDSPYRKAGFDEVRRWLKKNQ